MSSKAHRKQSSPDEMGDPIHRCETSQSSDRPWIAIIRAAPLAACRDSPGSRLPAAFAGDGTAGEACFAAKAGGTEGEERLLSPYRS